MVENSLRSQRTREAAIAAALAIVTRDGATKLTIDAIARESGVSKGGVLHHFRTKEAVLKALFEHQIESGTALIQSLLDGMASNQPERHLAAQIAAFRIAVSHPTSASFAIATAMADSPELLAGIRENDAKRIEIVKAEAADPTIALVRWSAAMGLALSEILGLSPVSAQERERLFDYLQDDRQWSQSPKPVPAKTRAHQALSSSRP
ncbi:TetR family transcriptional regulator [Acidisoma cellulosilytica]|uniref:TetR family transcriptional regulator n=1 Tax=Acidisoma cellulosilyticum TaxID=2802395 RepID=A0A964E3P9_9PROT|nr:TetR/AcrR family transcriptional regulator [Acidisoma cellulosilyticum]MCB8880173.1 TetR family transcriptional regulator [Acidisoma cellulosilyticum]